MSNISSWFPVLRRAFGAATRARAGWLSLLCAGVLLSAPAADRNAPPGITHAAGAVSSVASSDRTLSFERRLEYHRRLEEVYWKHRIWPAANPGQKPPLAGVLPAEAIRERVATYLKKSAALGTVWSRPLTGEQLQAEVNRMARETKKPEMLKELFTALDDDPLIIAECLARPVLADRLARNWYARDTRFHGALKQQAETALAAHQDVLSMGQLGGIRTETEWHLAAKRVEAPEERQTAEGDAERGARAVVDLTPAQWQDEARRLAATFGVIVEPERAGDRAALLDGLPVGALSPLTEETNRFAVTAVLSKEADRLLTATVSWTKRPFDAWWAEEARNWSDVTDGKNCAPVPPPLAGYAPAPAPADGCADDTWTRTAGRAPEGYYSAAVWTGAEMIVWGGSYEAWSAITNTGGRYDPATDTWNTTSTGANVPSARKRHTLVWTGTTMIVWGGQNDVTSVNTGGRYDPTTDTWNPTSTGANVPVNRGGHTAVWTG